MYKHPWDDPLKYRAGEPLLDMIDWDRPLALGAGTTIQAALKVIYDSRKYREQPVACGSEETEQVARGFGMVVIPRSRIQPGYTYIDGTDQFDPQFNLIKGGNKRTGNPGQEGCMKREKKLARSSGRFIVICDSSKEVEHLGQHGYKLPVEFDPNKRHMAKFSVSEAFPYMTDISVRQDPGGSFFETENHNWIYDVSFDGEGLMKDGFELRELEYDLKRCTGIEETGLFAVDRPHHIIVSSQVSGEYRIRILDRPR